MMIREGRTWHAHRLRPDLQIDKDADRGLWVITFSCLLDDRPFRTCRGMTFPGFGRLEMEAPLVSAAQSIIHEIGVLSGQDRAVLSVLGLFFRRELVERELAKFGGPPITITMADTQWWSSVVRWGRLPYQNEDGRRLRRFDKLREQGKTFGEINAILEEEGFSEVSGEGVMPCPTNSHVIVRENRTVKRMIKKGEISVQASQ